MTKKRLPILIRLLFTPRVLRQMADLIMLQNAEKFL